MGMCGSEFRCSVTQSVTKAEYIATFKAAREGIWLHTLLDGIHIPILTPTTILCNNNSTINLSEDPLLHACAKHIDIKYHFLRECVYSEDLTSAYVPLKDNVADIFMKALEIQHFQRLCGFLGLN